MNLAARSISLGASDENGCESCFDITTCWCERYKRQLVLRQIGGELKDEGLLTGVTVRLKFGVTAGR
jgi:hypothetical protein